MAISNRKLKLRAKSLNQQLKVWALRGDNEVIDYFNHELNRTKALALLNRRKMERYYVSRTLQVKLKRPRSPF